MLSKRSRLERRVEWLFCALVALACLLAIAARAHADVPLISTGPSVSFTRFGFKANAAPAVGDAAAVDVLSAGVGWTLHINPAKLQSASGDISYMSIDGTALAQFGSLPTSGGLAVAVGPSFYNGLVGIEVGYKLFDLSSSQPMEGLFAGGAGGRRNVFVLVNWSVNLLFQTKNPVLSTSNKKSASLLPPPNFWRLGR